MKFDREFLKREMKIEGLTMATLAKTLKRYDPKASRALVGYWLKGETIPSTKYILALSEIFHRKPTEFFDIED